MKYHRISIIFIALFILLFSLAGCSPKPEVKPEAKTGQIDLTLPVKELTSRGLSPQSVQVVAVMGSNSITKKVSITGDTATLQLQLAVGTWSLSISVFDANNDVIASGQKNVNIEPDKTTNASIDIYISSGQVSNLNLDIRIHDGPVMKQVTLSGRIAGDLNYSLSDSRLALLSEDGQIGHFIADTTMNSDGSFTFSPQDLWFGTGQTYSVSIMPPWEKPTFYGHITTPIDFDPFSSTQIDLGNINVPLQGCLKFVMKDSSGNNIPVNGIFVKHTSPNRGDCSGISNFSSPISTAYLPDIGHSDTITVTIDGYQPVQFNNVDVLPGELKELVVTLVPAQ